MFSYSYKFFFWNFSLSFLLLSLYLSFTLNPRTFNPFLLLRKTRCTRFQLKMHSKNVAASLFPSTYFILISIFVLFRSSHQVFLTQATSEPFIKLQKYDFKIFPDRTRKRAERIKSSLLKRQTERKKRKKQKINSSLENTKASIRTRS